MLFLSTVLIVFDTFAILMEGRTGYCFIVFIKLPVVCCCLVSHKAFIMILRDTAGVFSFL